MGMASTEQLTTEQWRAIGERLGAPFDPADVEFRQQGGGSGAEGGKVEVVAFVDARVVAARLDEVVGPGAWSFAWEPLIMDKAIKVAQGTLTIHGVPKSDVGDSGAIEPNKAAVSDALKRAAALWGVGRYLYALPRMHARVRGITILAEDVAALRAKLPQPGSRPDALTDATRTSIGAGLKLLGHEQMPLGFLDTMSEREGVAYLDELRRTYASSRATDLAERRDQTPQQTPAPQQPQTAKAAAGR